MGYWGGIEGRWESVLGEAGALGEELEELEQGPRVTGGNWGHLGGCTRVM